MKKSIFVLLTFSLCYVFAIDIDLNIKSLKTAENKPKNVIAMNNEEVSDENETTSIDVEKKRPCNRECASPAALIIVILIFVVLFAWPPIFMRLVEKKKK